MLPGSELLGSLPRWVLVGVLSGAIASLGVAILFVAAHRLFPAKRVSTGQSGETRRRAELRRYLRAIDEQFAEDHPVAGQQVEFYLPTRDVAITFDARAYYRIDRTETTPVLVEHEMPGVQLGSRLPFETPEVAFGRVEDRERDPTTAAFALLDLPTTATLSEVKRAYREKIKEVHPDQGGDEETFRRVREAYTTAKKHSS
ncbi:J domain-containing protein [Haloarculaceae archaeon H-GB1-1]|nr:J domain-containing protein [Haloarculaceae archaeon H-GB1-1]